MIPENSRLRLNATKTRNAGSDAPIEEPRKVWIKRWLAHLADFFIVVILSFVVYTAIGMPIVESTATYQDTVNLYNQKTDDKLKFLKNQHILIESNDEDEKYLSDNETLEIFVRSYIKPENGKYKDPIGEYYLCDAKKLTPYNQETAGKNYRPEYQPNTEPKSLSEKEYTKLLIKKFNDDSHSVFDDKEEKAEMRNEPKELLSQYLGIDKPVDKNDTNSNFWRYLLGKFNSLRLQATREALSSLEEMPTEIALVETYAKINNTRINVLLVSWAIAYLLAFGLPILFFKNGRTIGKRVLGFYVLSKADTKASALQQIGRILLIFPQTFFGIIFPMFLIFGGNLFAIPLFGSVTLLLPATISFVLLLCSDALSFASKGDMSNLQDWLTYSKVIHLKDGHGLDEVMQEKKKTKKEPTALDIEDNIFGKKSE